MALELIINGRPEVLEALAEGQPLALAVRALNLKADRIAVELNGEIAPRDTWSQLGLKGGDRLEIVHFVGGGTGSLDWRPDLIGAAGWERSRRCGV